MRKLFDEDFESIELIEGGVILNKTIDPNFPDVKVKAQIEALREELATIMSDPAQLSPEATGKEKLALIIEVFYQRWGFVGDDETFFHSNNSLLDKVLEKRKGLPVTLGALLLFFCRQHNLPVEGVNFPTQFLLRFNWSDNDIVYLNPFIGEYTDEHTLQAWIIGYEGPLAKLERRHLETADNPMVIGRWLGIIKQALISEDRFELALSCSKLVFTFNDDDPNEFRDRGLIYHKLGCDAAAIADLEYFLSKAPPGVEATLVGHELEKIKLNRPTVVH
ncbi:hypothetical protein BCU68_15235 [Vibrio sp. 10N.286.49.B3]|uniref:SirB1 family protein n=1 Tax=Vibrio sp. 10N.286.49.B3 TaxID=1880855 RepID=UPI000C85F341|nr:tetratricopeptide repeat protein [Vibrio sp. 10N.286.49.B3]PMH41804.1 hypothetical protein BCU68_15235 [Vibrio sp. 10N.286.49.B3]